MPEDELQTITVSGLPPSLLEKVESIATSEHRNRSNWIVKTIAEAVEEARRLKRSRKSRKPSSLS